MTRRLILFVVTGVLVALMPAGATAQTSDPVYRFNGAGWGHAVGLAQYGARAMAEDGYSADQILTTYYPGATARSLDSVLGAGHWLRSDPAPLWIGVAQNQASLRFTMVNGSAGLCKANDGEGTCPTQTANPGEDWEIRTLGDGRCQFFLAGAPVGNPGDCRATIEWTGQPDVRIRFPDLGKEYARGSIRIRPAGPDPAAAGIHVVLEVGIEDYVYGIGEVPSSWPAAALQAQAVAARTYGIRQALRWGPESSFSSSRQTQCWCQLYATVVDQNYVGWAKESDAYGAAWTGAVNATAGRIVTHPQAPDSTVIVAYYSSSSGGHTDSNIAGLGQSTVLPYVPGVPDPWSVAPEAKNPYAAWAKDVSGTAVAGAVGLDAVTGMGITRRNPSGSVAEVKVQGAAGGAAKTVTVSGRTLRSALGLRSIFFTLVAPPGGGLVTRCTEAPTAGFLDVAATSVHRVDIDCISYYSITAGVAPGRYDPTGKVTRWQMALFLVREAETLGLPVLPAADQGFTDLGGLSDEARAAINQLRQLGITAGVTPTTYDPAGAVSRWQMALFLTRLYDLLGVAGPTVVDFGFTDLAGLDPSWVAAVNKIATLGITAGTASQTYSPYTTVTREQMASFLARLLESTA